MCNFNLSLGKLLTPPIFGAQWTAFAKNLQAGISKCFQDGLLHYLLLTKAFKEAYYKPNPIS